MVILAQERVQENKTASIHNSFNSQRFSFPRTMGMSKISDIQALIEDTPGLLSYCKCCHKTYDPEDIAMDVYSWSLYEGGWRCHDCNFRHLRMAVSSNSVECSSKRGTKRKDMSASSSIGMEVVIDDDNSIAQDIDKNTKCPQYLGYKEDKKMVYCSHCEISYFLEDIELIDLQTWLLWPDTSEWKCIRCVSELLDCQSRHRSFSYMTSDEAVISEQQKNQRCAMRQMHED